MICFKGKTSAQYRQLLLRLESLLKRLNKKETFSCPQIYKNPSKSPNKKARRGRALENDLF